MSHYAKFVKEPTIEYRVGEIYSFTVNSIKDNFAELIDSTGFKVFLKRTNPLMLVRGQRIRCKVVKYTEKRPKIEFFDYGGTMEEASAQVNEGVVVGFLRELGATWAVDEMATLLMKPEREGSFETDCQRWIADLQGAGADLAGIRADCTRFMEQSRFFALCNTLERQLYQERMTTLVEWLDCNVTAQQLARDGRAAAFVDDLLGKLRLSGYVYRPVWNFNVLSSLFLIDPALMKGKMVELFDALRLWNSEMWLEKPMGDILSKLIQLYIDHDIWTVDHVRDNAPTVSALLQALTIQLKLMDDRGQDDLYRLDLSRLSTLSTYAVKSDGQKTLCLSLSNLLNQQPQQSPYSWADTANQRVPILFSQITPAPIDTESTYVFGGGKLAIDQSGFVLSVGKAKNPKEALPAAIGLWGGLSVVADRTDLHPLGANPTIKDCKRFWEDVEQAIFAPVAEVRPATAKKHRVGQTVTITVTKQDAERPDLFLAEIDDETGGKGYITLADIVPYTVKANIVQFRWSNGQRMRLEAEIIDKDEGDLFHFSMREGVKRFITGELMEYGQELLVSLGSEPPRNPRAPIPAVTRDGISVSLMGFDEVPCHGVRRGQVVKARYVDEASGDFILKCKVIGTLDIPEYNDMQAAFQHLMETYAFEPQDEEDSGAFERSDRMLDNVYMRELVRIVDRMSVLDNEYVRSYCYLGFARTLCRLIGWDSQAAYYRGRMELIVLLHDFAINDMVDEERLAQLANTNAELFHGNALLHNRFMQLQMVSFMGRDDRDDDLWTAYQAGEGVVKDVASLVIAYNMVWRNNMRTQATDIQNRIKKTLRLEGYESGLKIYGSGIEDLVTEYKTSIVYPPASNMMPDMDKQMHNILLVIASFLNTDGGTLYIGVNDSGAGTGIGEDLRYPYFYGDKDKYQRTIIDAVSLTWGNQAATYIQTQFDATNKDKDVLIVTVKPYKNGVELDGTCPVRVGSTKRRLTVKEFAEFKLDRQNRTAVSENSDIAESTDMGRSQSENSEKEITHAATTSAEVSTVTAPVVKPAEKLATSLIHPNVLLDYEPDYREFIACLRVLDTGKFVKLPMYYDDPHDSLTLAVYDEDQDGFLVLGYDDGTVTKVPVRELMKMTDYQEYSRFADVPLVFATIAHNDDALVTVATENKNHGRKMVRADRLSTLGEGKIADRGTRPYNEGLARAGVAYEMVPAADLEPLKNILDRDVRSLGFQLKTCPPEILQTLFKHGVK